VMSIQLNTICHCTLLNLQVATGYANEGPGASS
jgi:hypothetical protein